MEKKHSQSDPFPVLYDEKSMKPHRRRSLSDRNASRGIGDANCKRELAFACDVSEIYLGRRGRGRGSGGREGCLGLGLLVLSAEEQQQTAWPRLLCSASRIGWMDFFNPPDRTDKVYLDLDPNYKEGT